MSDNDDISRLFKSSAQAETEINLHGLSLDEAVEQVETALEEFKSEGTRTILIRIGQVTDIGGQTLFQPIGKLLLDLKRDKQLARCEPVHDGEGAAFYVEL